MEVGFIKKGALNISSRKTIKAASVVVGITGMLGQLLLMRELLVTFHGNEMTIGIVVANWLLLEAVGSFAAGKTTTRIEKPLPVYLGLLVSFAAALTAALFFARTVIIVIFDVLPGESVGLGGHFMASFLVLLLPSLTHGALYPYGAELLKGVRDSHAAGSVYVFENLGTLAAGLVFTFLLAGKIETFTIGTAILLLHFIVAIVLLMVFPGGTKRKKTLLPGFIAFTLLIVILSPVITPHFHRASLERRWSETEVVHHEDTPYGNITVLKKDGEHTFYYDGRPLFTAPVPDLARIKDYIHLGASSHPSPQKVLMLGGGMGGCLQELLRHGAEKISYVELDPHLPRAAGKFDISPLKEELADPRINIKIQDGRRYLTEAKGETRYDLIIMGFIGPETLQSNRLFTKEFYELAKGSLNEDGIFIFNLPGSREYMGRHLKLMNSSIYHAADSVFNHLHLIPGDDNIFLAAANKIDLSPRTIQARLDERGIEEGMFGPGYLDYRLDQGVKEEARISLEVTAAGVNQDLNPAGFYYTLQYWGEMFSPEFNRILDLLRSLRVFHYLALVLISTAAVFLLAARRKGGNINIPLNYAIFTSGVLGMAFDLFVIFIFQTYYGYVYEMVGLLLAAFMSGIFAGSVLSNAMWVKKEDFTPLNSFRRFKQCEIMLIVLTAGLVVIAVSLSDMMGAFPGAAIIALLIAFSAISGLPIGAQFPLAVYMAREKGESSMQAGSLYAADLAGGWISALLISVVLFPVLGLPYTVLLLIILKIGSLIILHRSGLSFEIK